MTLNRHFVTVFYQNFPTQNYRYTIQAERNQTLKTEEHRTISAAFVVSVLDKSNLPDEQKKSFLKRCEITPPVLNGGKYRVHPDQFARLCSLVSEATQDASMGHFRSRLKPEALVTMARYTRDGKNLQEAIERNIEFYNLFDTGFQLALTESGAYANYQMQADPQFPLSTWVYEQHLMVNHRFLCWLLGVQIPLIRVNLHYPQPAHSQEYHYLFHSEIRFQQVRTEMLFDRKLLALPTIRTQDSLETYLHHFPYRLLQAPNRDSSYTTQIRGYLKNALPQHAGYDEIAESLNLTPQTLRRRLACEGADFRQIKNELLRDLAISQLQTSDADIKTIAYQLGFSEPSAFIRSFRRWTGCTPSSYKQAYCHGVVDEAS
ncbi:AraC family transcriptional regulator [Halioxenophilus sp. WMMB6]|uniref:AraC family transcriptional regulator n=1 Tax=Halioxenophilus sp. WMMB6 TaxID=3073815 RepID=UPI00295F46D8|nr:AraC family transcriptional regulator ligand-binding domain-containing protein [Halioxenophilus sp. WMMB6]